MCSLCRVQKPWASSKCCILRMLAGRARALCVVHQFRCSPFRCLTHYELMQCGLTSFLHSQTLPQPFRKQKAHKLALMTLVNNKP